MPFLFDIQDNVTDYQVEPVKLTSEVLHEKIKSVFDYRCIISGAEHQFYIISLGVSNCWCYCIVSFCYYIYSVDCNAVNTRGDRHGDRRRDDRL